MRRDSQKSLRTLPNRDHKPQLEPQQRVIQRKSIKFLYKF